jgi:hypothetical protein
MVAETLSVQAQAPSSNLGSCSYCARYVRDADVSDVSQIKLMLTTPTHGSDPMALVMVQKSVAVYVVNKCYKSCCSFGKLWTSQVQGREFMVVSF